MTILKPVDRASITASIGASTEKQPLIAQAQGISSGRVLPMNVSPRGKGIPMSAPAGMSSRKTRAIFMVVEK